MVILGLVDMRINNFGGFIQNVPIILLSCLTNVTSHDKSAGTGLPKFSAASSQNIMTNMCTNPALRVSDSSMHETWLYKY